MNADSQIADRLQLRAPASGQRLAVCVLILLLATVASAQDTPQRRAGLPAESKETALRLAAADRLVRPEPDPEEIIAAVGSAAGLGLPNLGPVLVNAQRQQWPKALEEYQRIIYDEGDRLVVVEEAPSTATVRSVQARMLCHQRIAAAPAWVRALYNKRVKNLVNNLFRDGQENQNLEAWRRLVSDHFCSDPAEKALVLLGDIAFENGDFARAGQWWGLLADLPSAVNDRSGRLTYPADDATQARAQARQILALAHDRDFVRARAEWRHFEKRHGKILARFAGKQGLLAGIIKQAIDQIEEDRSSQRNAWHSFGCDATRNQRVPLSLNARLWADGAAWRVLLASGKKADSPDGVAARAVTQPARRLAFHPVISGDVVLVASARSVSGYHLLTGDKIFHYHLNAKQDGAADDESAPVEPDHGYTLTVAGNRLYVRLGTQKISPLADGNNGNSYLVCVEMIPGKRSPLLEAREVWRVVADKDGAAQFEGSPVVDGQRVYAALSRVQGRRTFTALVCHDAGSGMVRWRQEVCEADEFELPGQGPRFRHHLATLAGRYLVYCTHTGVVAAVDARTGKPAWAVRYPSQGLERPDGSRSPRDLCPALFAAGRLFVAPSDSDRILCLDPASGRILWERHGIEVVHLLGAAGESLFFTTPSGLRAVGAHRGTDQGGWSQPADGRLPPFGRGLLAGNWVFWPTADVNFPMRVVTQEEGGQEHVERPGDPAPVFDPTQLHRLRAGNMVFAKDCLIVAGTEELVGYVPPQRGLDKLRLQARQASANARTFLALAEAETGAGLHDDALKHYQVAAKVSRDPAVRRRALLGWHERLMHMAQTADRKQATAILELAGASKFPAAKRLTARFALAELYQSAGALQRSVATLQDALLDDGMRNSSIVDLSGIPRVAGTMLRERIQQLIDKHGSPVYAALEEQAGKLARSAGNDRRKLEHLARCYPHSTQVKHALASLKPESRPLIPPEDGTGPAVPLTVGWERPASAIWRVEAAGQPPNLILLHGGQLALSDPATGKPRWHRPISFQPDWAGQHDNRLVLAGRRNIEVMHAQDGRLIWRLHAGATSWGDFSAFQMTPSQLLFLQDGRRLIALSLDNGAVDWSCFAPGAQSLPLDSGRFSPTYLATARHVLIQGIRGQLLCLASNDGELLRETPTVPLWLQAPLPINNGRACITNSRRLTLVDMANGKEVWHHEPAWQTSSSGEPLRVAGDARTLLVIVPRNYGYEVERLDAATGRPLWDDEPRLLSRRRIDLASLALTDDALYYAGGSSLTCRSMATGKVVWQKELPAAGAWRLRCTGTEIVVVPAGRAANPWLWLPAGSFLLGLPASRASATSSIFIFDRRDGRLHQTLRQPAAGAGTAIHVFPQTIITLAGEVARGWRNR